MDSKRKLYLFLILGFSFQLVNGQNLPSDVSKDLEKLFGRMLTVTQDSVRKGVNDSIIAIVDSYAN